MSYVTSFEHIGFKKGHEKGREEGRDIGLREGLLEGIALDLETKFGKAERKLLAKAKAVTELDELRDLARFIRAPRAWRRFAVPWLEAAAHLEGFAGNRYQYFIGERQVNGKVSTTWS